MRGTRGLFLGSRVKRIQRSAASWLRSSGSLLACAFLLVLMLTTTLQSQGVTTAGLQGVVTNGKGEPLPGANVIAVHRPSRTIYGSAARTGGEFNIAHIRVGGPYFLRVSHVGYKTLWQDSIYVSLGQSLRLNFQLKQETLLLNSVHVTGLQNRILNTDRTGAATLIQREQVSLLPSITRSANDLFRLDPRSDGNFSFSGRNWHYNNLLLDGSSFNNPFGLEHPAPGGQSNAQPVPFESIAQIQVNVAPFDVRQSGFTGASINTITRSGDNEWRGSLYSYLRSESFVGGEVSGEEIINPDMSFHQTGFAISGPLNPNRMFFFLNAEMERRDDLATTFRASRSGFGGPNVSRVRAEDLLAIRERMRRAYGYDPGPFENYEHETNNEKLLLKVDWNINPFNNVSFRYNRLDARRDRPPDPFELAFNDLGRGPNQYSLPFRDAGYEINNELNSFAIEIDSREGHQFANRLFLGYDRFRDLRDPFSEPFPTIEIIVDDTTYTTLGHEPFSINNFVDQDVWRVTDDFSIFIEKHALTFGASLEVFKFNRSFNPFYYGVFTAPAQLEALGGGTFFSLEDFFRLTDPDNPDQIDFNQTVLQFSQEPFKVDETDLGQLGFYVQDELAASDKMNVTMGLRVDFPLYFSDIPENDLASRLVLMDDEDNFEDLNVSEFPGTQVLFSPRFGFNWDVYGDRTMQVRGGTGIFTGRLPFMWLANQVANQGPGAEFPTFNINATVEDFRWPQVWKTDLAIDQKLPWDMLGTFEILYGNDINNVFVRNANLARPTGRLPAPDGRPVYTRGTDENGNPLNSLNPDVLDAGAGVFVLDNTQKGHHLNITTQIRKRFAIGLDAMLAYNFTEAKNKFTSTEQADRMWQTNPIARDPNSPELGYSEFGHRHRIVGAATYHKRWSPKFATHVGLFLDVAEGRRFSYVYTGDINGDGASGNDLVYIPRNATEITFAEFADSDGNTVTAADQWLAFDRFIRSDSYLSSHRGEIAERNGATNPWFSTIDLKILQDLKLNFGGQRHTFQVSLDILNVGNLLNSSWGVREIATSSAKSPLVFTGNFDADTGQPIFRFPETVQTFQDDIGLNSRWRMQFGIRYLFN